jgi:hypothetical protein
MVPATFILYSPDPIFLKPGFTGESGSTSPQTLFNPVTIQHQKAY